MKGLAITNIVILGLAWMGLIVNVASGESTSSDAMWAFILTAPMMVFAILYLAVKK